MLQVLSKLFRGTRKAVPAWTVRAAYEAVTTSSFTYSKWVRHEGWGKESEQRIDLQSEKCCVVWQKRLKFVGRQYIETVEFVVDGGLYSREIRVSLTQRHINYICVDGQARGFRDIDPHDQHLIYLVFAFLRAHIPPSQ